MEYQLSRLSSSTVTVTRAQRTGAALQPIGHSKGRGFVCVCVRAFVWGHFYRHRAKRYSTFVFGAILFVRSQNTRDGRIEHIQTGRSAHKIKKDEHKFSNESKWIARHKLLLFLFLYHSPVLRNKRGEKSIKNDMTTNWNRLRS